MNTKCLFLVIKTIAAHCAEQILYDIWQIFISVAATTLEMYFHSCLSKLDATLLKIIFTPILKAGFHTCFSRTHGGAECLLMYGHQCSKTIPAFATKACVLASLSHMSNFSEGLPEYRKYFLFSGKEEQNQRTILLERLSECKSPHNRTYNGCLWKPAKCSKVRASKQLRFVVSPETFNGKSLTLNDTVILDGRILSQRTYSAKHEFCDQAMQTKSCKPKTLIQQNL